MPNNWKKYKLGDVADIQNGYAFGAKEFSDKGIPIIKIKNIVPPYISFDEAQYYNNPLDAKLEKYLINLNDILISMTGSTVNQMSSAVGKIGRYRFNYPALLNQRVSKLYLTKPELADYNYLYYYISRYEVQYNLALNATGSANQANISPAQIKDIDLELPPLQEQQAIAEILSSLDDKIELNLQTNKTLEEMANALYKHWFVDFGPFQNGKFVESELGLIPEGFKLVSFKDVCFNHSKTYNFKGKEKVIFVNTGDILEGKFLHNNYSDVEGLPGQAKKIIEPDDILFSEIRPGNKRYALINFDASDYVVSTKFMVIRSNQNILPRILYRILRDEKIIKEFQSIAESRSGTFPQITFDAISGISFPMSNIEIQNQFIEKVLPLEHLIDNNNIEIESLKQTRDYLLPKLISGEIRVKDAAKKLKEVL